MTMHNYFENCQNMPIKHNRPGEDTCCFHSDPPTPCWLTFVDLCRVAGFPLKLKPAKDGFFLKPAEMPLSAGFSCRKQQNCELNLESDERTWTGTPDISQICCSVGVIVLLTALTSGLHFSIHTKDVYQISQVGWRITYFSSSTHSSVFPIDFPNCLIFIESHIPAGTLVILQTKMCCLKNTPLT